MYNIEWRALKQYTFFRELQEEPITPPDKKKLIKKYIVPGREKKPVPVNTKDL